MADTGCPVLVIDASPVVATALAMALARLGFETATVRPGGDAGAVVQQARDAGARVVLVDPGALGAAVADLVAPLHELGAAVVLLSEHDAQVELVGTALSAGADAVVPKSAEFERLVETVRDVAAGRPAMSPADRDALVSDVEGRLASQRRLWEPFERLTRREGEVLALLVEGSSPASIARRTKTSVSTVRGHIRQVLAKLDATSQREALARARAAGWPQPDQAGSSPTP